MEDDSSVTRGRIIMFHFQSYFSVQYLVVLLPITVILYAFLPQKARRVVLLVSSYLFFWAISGKLIVYLLFEWQYRVVGSVASAKKK